MPAAKLSTHRRRGLHAPHLRGAGAAGHASRPHAGPAAHVPEAPRVTSKAAKSQQGYFVTGTQMTRLRRKRWRQWSSGSGAGFAAEAHEWVEPRVQPTSVPWQGRGGASTWAGGGRRTAARLLFSSTPPAIFGIIQLSSFCPSYVYIRFHHTVTFGLYYLLTSTPGFQMSLNMSCKCCFWEISDSPTGGLGEFILKCA